MTQIKTTTIILAAILLLSLLLNAYGIQWGLPYRLNPDEHVARTLRMIKNESPHLFLEEKNKIGHPTGYNYFLSVFLLAWMGISKMLGTDLNAIVSAASISWVKLAQDYPGFAFSIQFVARLLSSALGAFSVFLTYLIAKRLFNRQVGLWSALILTLNMGFVAAHHFAKNTGLVLALVMCCLLFCIKALQEREFGANFLLAAAFSGLAIATKYDGGITLVALAATWVMALVRKKNSARFLLLQAMLALGIIFIAIRLVWPSLFYSFEAYHYKVTQNTMIFGWPQSLSVLLQRMHDYALLIISNCNLALSILVALGCFHIILKWRRYPGESLPLILTLIAYFLVISVIYLFRSSKYAILSFPILSIIAAHALYLLLSAARRHRLAYRTLVGLIFSIFAYSFGYCLRADLVFAREDTRYHSTQWLMDNLPAGSSIGIFVEPLNYCLPEIYKKFDVVWYQDYLPPRIDADVLLHCSWEQMLFEDGLTDYQTRPQIKEMFQDLLAGRRRDYLLAKKFVYPEDALWHPRPAYTCPVVYIFKKNRGGGR